MAVLITEPRRKMPNRAAFGRRIYNKENITKKIKII
jgi:hypothetical protein